MKQLVAGQIVSSRQGRDHGRKYVVIGEVENGFVLVADGYYRKAEQPKRKNVKHLVLHGVLDKEIALRIAKGKPITNQQLRQALKCWAAEEGGSDCNG